MFVKLRFFNSLKMNEGSPQSTRSTQSFIANERSSPQITQSCCEFKSFPLSPQSTGMP